MNIFFRNYDKNNKLDVINKKLNKNSNGRFELFKSSNGKYYMKDYDEVGYISVVKAYKEIEDILSCMNIDFKEVQ